MSFSKKTVGYGILTNYLNYIISILLGILLSPLVLKFAGQETMGGYAILIQLISYVGLIDLGIGLSTTRFLSQEYAISFPNFVKTCNLYRSIGILQNAIMAFFFILLSFFIQNIFHFSEPIAIEMKKALWMLAIWNLLSSPFNIYSGLLFTTNHLSLHNIIEAISNFIRICFAIFFVYQGWAIIGLVGAQILSQLFSLTTKWYFINSKIGKIPFNFSLSFNNKFRQILSFSTNSFLITIAIKLVFSTDNLMLGYLFGPIIVSTFYLTFQPGNMINQFLLRITDNLTPSLNIWYANKELDKLKKSFFYLFRITFLLTILMSWGIILCTEVIVDLWVGHTNYLPQPMAVWVGLFTASIVLGHVPNAFVMAEGRIKILGYFALFEGVLNLGLSFTLGKHIGAHGVMLASFIANIPTTIYLYYRGTKILECQKAFFEELLQWKYFFAITILPITWYITGTIINILDIKLLNFVNIGIQIFLSYSIVIVFMYRVMLSKSERFHLLQKLKLVKNVPAI